ncbi:hypothetical protein CASFOL_011963 [Castilleja foliolosa]|uniref:RING-type domain-containing protein n=1 Tax=Castilleja foliolosa TaxID=1961234 RepID=A0ABD3DP25_9LAMI
MEYMIVNEPLCVICQEKYVDEEIINRFSCGHISHSDCVTTWFSKNGSKCPTCNRLIRHEERVFGKALTVKTTVDQNEVPPAVDAKEAAKEDGSSKKPPGLTDEDISNTFESCPKCHGPFPVFVPVARIMQCGHFFHKHCMEIMKNLKNVDGVDIRCPCPLCKGDPVVEDIKKEIADDVQVPIPEGTIITVDGVEVYDEDELHGTWYYGGSSR